MEEDEPFHAPFWGKHPIRGIILYALVVILGILLGHLHGYITKLGMQYITGN